MSEESGPQGPTLDAGIVPLRLLAQYIKDLSFEVPNAPEIFNILRTTAPEIPTSLDMGMRHLSDNTYEVTLSAHIEAFAGGKSAFILEVEYGCIVEVNENAIGPAHIHPVLLMEIPRQMFPFVRQIVADTTVNGGFPPLMLQLVDFGDMYQKKFGVAGQKVEAAPADATIN
jgi:preprotein translocase subunit SecB